MQLLEFLVLKHFELYIFFWIMIPSQYPCRFVFITCLLLDLIHILKYKPQRNSLQFLSKHFGQGNGKPRQHMRKLSDTIPRYPVLMAWFTLHARCLACRVLNT